MTFSAVICFICGSTAAVSEEKHKSDCKAILVFRKGNLSPSSKVSDGSAFLTLPHRISMSLLFLLHLPYLLLYFSFHFSAKGRIEDTLQRKLNGSRRPATEAVIGRRCGGMEKPWRRKAAVEFMIELICVLSSCVEMWRVGGKGGGV